MLGAAFHRPGAANDPELVRLVGAYLPSVAAPEPLAGVL